MISSFMEGLRQFFRALQIWITIAPWEQGLRVRLGKHVRLLHAGVHLKIPIIDVLYIQTVRTRISSLGRQIATTSDGKAITLSGSIGYAISDIETLYRSMHHAEDTIQALARARIASYISRNVAEHCHPSEMERPVSSALAEELNQYGICEVKVYITEFAVVRTYRLIGDYTGNGVYGSPLMTDRPISIAQPTPS